MAEESESNNWQREWKTKPLPLSLVWGWHTAGMEHVHPGKVSMLSLTQVPVCVWRASLHYTWHLWFHALHTPHGQSFSSTDSSSFLSPSFITHLLCSITILINLTSAHIRAAITFACCWQNRAHTQKSSHKKQGSRCMGSWAETVHKHKQMSACWGKCASSYLSWMALTASVNYANLIKQLFPARGLCVYVCNGEQGERGRGGQEDTAAPEGVPFFEVALSSSPSKWSGVWLRQLTRSRELGLMAGFYQEHVSASTNREFKGQEALRPGRRASLHRLHLHFVHSNVLSFVFWKKKKKSRVLQMIITFKEFIL